MSTRQFPKTYLEFEGKKIIDGKRRQYWIQDATEDMFQEIEDLVQDHYIGAELISKYLKCSDDPQSMVDFRFIYRKMLEEKYTIVCLTKDNEGNVKLAGFNILTENSPDGKNHYNLNGSSIKRVFKIFEYIETKRNLHQEFKLERIIKAMGLYVLPDYRGEGLGDRLLEAREFLCRNVGISATLTVVTTAHSQKLASRVGFTTYFEIDYEDLGKIDPEMHIPDIQNDTKTLKYMYKLYE